MSLSLFNIKWTNAICVCLLVLSYITPLRAQNPTDTSGKVPIEILAGNNTSLIYTATDSGGITKLINNVSLKQGETLMYCDSAYINRDKNNMEAFGNVRIVQTGGTEVQSDYLRYTGNTKKAYLKGNVSLTDGKNNLWSDELEYDVATKIGTYNQGGTLQSDATTLSSNSGMYNVRTKDARFTGEVFVTDPDYNVTSDDLGYNTESKMVRFFGPSVVTSDQSVLRTSSGTWDSKSEIAHFLNRSSILNKEQYIEADNIDYNKKTGFGTAAGKVIVIDTVQKTTLYCGYVQYNQRSRKSLASINPVMKKMNGTDSLFIRADTFYSAPVVRENQKSKVKTQKEADSLGQKSKVKSQNGVDGGSERSGKKGQDEMDVVGSKDSVVQKLAAKNNGAVRKDSRGKGEKRLPERNVVERVVADEDTVVADSTSPRYFTGYHHVLVFSDSMQARCDSIVYSQADSTMRMMYAPIAWSRNSQITGDTILIYMDSSRLKRAFVPNNALVVSRSGPEKAQMYDQVQGKTLTAYFENNAIQEVVVWPSAESIYYSKDDDDAYLGVNQAQSERMKVFFDKEEISKIVLEQDVKQTMTPMKQANISGLRLSRFQWLEDKRPKAVTELFNYKSPGKQGTADSAGTIKQPSPAEVKMERRERKRRK